MTNKHQFPTKEKQSIYPIQYPNSDLSNNIIKVSYFKVSRLCI